MKKIRKGEITTQQIVLLIILLVSFVVILFLLFRLNLGKESDNEICHNSVVMRGNAVVPTDAVPLKCSREYVCLTFDGSCEGMTSPEMIKVKTENEIYQTLAEKMADCWWMFGEGKIDYAGKDILLKNNYCSICSQILFDDSLNEIEEIEGRISKDRFYDYLSVTPMAENEINYAEYLFGIDNVQLFKSQKIETEEGTEIEGVTFGTIELGEQYFVLMGITSEVRAPGKVLIAIGTGVYLFVGIFSGETQMKAFNLLVMKKEGAIPGKEENEIAAIVVEGEEIKNSFIVPTILKADSDTLGNLNCKDIVTLA